jgi:hypothetical protein
LRAPGAPPHFLGLGEDFGGLHWSHKYPATRCTPWEPLTLATLIAYFSRQGLHYGLQVHRLTFVLRRISEGSTGLINTPQRVAPLGSPSLGDNNRLVSGVATIWRGSERAARLFGFTVVHSSAPRRPPPREGPSRRAMQLRSPGPCHRPAAPQASAASSPFHRPAAPKQVQHRK